MSPKNNIIWYLEKMIELLCVSPNENQFQSYLVYPIIEEVINKKKEYIGTELIDCHNFRQDNTKAHTRCKYSVLSKAVPDLLLAKNFFYNNRDKKIYDSMQSIASVEVKEPNSDDMLNKYVNSESDENKKEYKDQLYIQVLPGLIKNKKVILTNVRKWEFFHNSLINDENPDLGEDIKTYVEILEICGFDSSTDYINYIKKELKIEVIESKKELLKKIIDHLTKEERKSKLQKELELLLDKESKTIVKSDFEDIIELADNKYIKEIKKYIKLSHMKTIEIIKLKKNEREKTMVVYGSAFDQMMEAGDNEYITGIHDVKYNLNSLENLKLELENFLYEN